MTGLNQTEIECAQILFNGKTLSESSMEKLKPFMNSEKQAQMFASMNRKQRRAFLAKNKKLLKK